MSAPDAAAFAARTAELDACAADLAAAEQAMTEALVMLADAETHLGQILADDGDGITALATMEQAAAGVSQAEAALIAALARATTVVATRESTAT